MTESWRGGCFLVLEVGETLFKSWWRMNDNVVSPLLLPKEWKRRRAFFGLKQPFGFFFFGLVRTCFFVRHWMIPIKRSSLLLSGDVSFDLSTHFLTYVTLIIYCLSFLLNGLANWPFSMRRLEKAGYGGQQLGWFFGDSGRRLDILSSFYFQSLYTLSMKGSGLWGSTQKEMTFQRKAKMHLVSL